MYLCEHNVQLLQDPEFEIRMKSPEKQLNFVSAEKTHSISNSSTNTDSQWVSRSTDFNKIVHFQVEILVHSKKKSLRCFSQERFWADYEADAPKGICNL